MADIRRLLLIDDDADFRNSLSTRLRARGYEITPVASCQEGLGSLHQHTFDLILLDMLMPEQDGMETYQTIRANPDTRKVPIILLTGMAAEGHWEQLPYDTDGPCYVMGKPYDISILEDRITQLLVQTHEGKDSS